MSIEFTRSFSHLFLIGSIGVVAGCDPNWKWPTNGETGTGTPTVYTCSCDCTEGVDWYEDRQRTSLCEIGAPEAGLTCDAFCDSFDKRASVGQVLIECNSTTVVQTEEACTPDAEGESLDSSGDPEATDATLDDGESTAQVMYSGESATVPVNGEIEFTGGCATGACAMSFRQISLHPADFTIRDRDGTTLRMSNITVVNVGSVDTTLTDGTFVIPRSAIRVLARAEGNGVMQAVTFEPLQDLEGHYSASRGTFGLYGDVFSGEDTGLQFELASASIRRPPTADAGRDQTLTLPPRTTTATVTLDGTASRDLDGNLRHIDWFLGAQYLGRGSTLRHAFGRGQHVVTAVAVDGTGKRDTATTTVSVR